jgi:hypothetical protein
MFSTVACVFLIVISLEALVVPTFAVKLVIELVERVTGALPEPFRVIVCGLNRASSGMFSVAVLVPVPKGVKVIESWQLAGAAPREVGTKGQVKSLTWKSPALGPVIEGGEMFSGMFCLLVTVTVLGGLSVPTS